MELYLSDLLEIKYGVFFKDIQKLLIQNKISFNLIKNTNDIWVRDFMPIRNTQNELILFRYYSTYLRAKKYKDLISDNHKIAKQEKLNFQYSDIILDGGNVLIHKNKAIISDGIFRDNKFLEKHKLLSEIEKLLAVDQLFILPHTPNDFTQHVDGMLQWLDEKTILLSNPEFEKSYYKTQLFRAINKYKLDFEIIENATFKNNEYTSAKGCYINYLEINNIILFPTYNIKEDDIAFNKIKKIFPSKTILTINCNKLAKYGGVIHCCTWEN